MTKRFQFSAEYVNSSDSTAADERPQKTSGTGTVYGLSVSVPDLKVESTRYGLGKPKRVVIRGTISRE